MSTQNLNLNKGKLFAYMAKFHKNFFETRPLANHVLQGSRAVQDQELINFLKSLDVKDQYHDLGWLRKFTGEFKSWLGDCNIIDGLDHLEADFSAGTTQSFDSFYYRHRFKRFRCFIGEYFYHLKHWQSTETDWSFISDADPLVKGDALVLSLPFCDTGNLYAGYEHLLQFCERNQIPVLIDCCYYTLTNNIKLNLNFDCIDTVSFSLSKSFPVSHLRIGVRYLRKSVMDGQKLHDSINYNNNISAFIGYKFLEKFACNHIYTKYRSKQEEVCNYFNLEPSASVIFSIGDSAWDQYSRKTLIDAYGLDFDHKLFKNRICLNIVYENWSLFESLKNAH